MKLKDIFCYRLIFLVFLTFVFCIYIPSSAEAIPPPEIVRVGSIVAQVIGFFFVFFSTAFFMVRRKITQFLSQMHLNKKMLFAGLFATVIVILISLTSFLIYNYKTRQVILHEGAKEDRITIDEGAVAYAGMQLDVDDNSQKISAEEASRLLGNTNYIFIDVREPVEYQIRHVPGFQNIRVGDLIAGGEYKKLDKNKEIIVICEAGERGSAVVIFLRLKGYKARFVNRGIREWQAKKLKYTGSAIFKMPDFRNKYTELKPDDVKKMVQDGKAVLIDVRSPSEYKKGHLKDAVNIPLVNMPSKELDLAIRRLPGDRMVVGIGYDRFGIFYCKILGYLIDKYGLQYGGTLKVDLPEYDF